MKFWFQLKPKLTKNFDALTEAYNEKYGNYDYSKDSRAIDKTFEQVLVQAVGNISDKDILVCGSNSGYEIKIFSRLYTNAHFTALDISTLALSKILNPEVRHIHANMELLPFADKQFDICINCRAIHSTDVDLTKALNEVLRVTKSKIIISVSNGYLIENKIVKGMYDYGSKKIDPNKPFEIVAQIKDFFIKQHLSISETESEAELFIIANLN